MDLFIISQCPVTFSEPQYLSVVKEKGSSHQGLVIHVFAQVMAQRLGMWTTRGTVETKL